MKTQMLRIVVPSIVFLLAAFTLTVNAGEPFELMTHDTFVAGKDDVDAGAFDQGIAKLEKRLSDSMPLSTKIPTLIDLCVAHTMQKNLREATMYCDLALESSWYTGLSYNNRGVLQIAKGNYEAAARDFEAAIRNRGADAMARRNLGRATARLAAIESQKQQTTSVAAVFDSK